MLNVCFIVESSLYVTVSPVHLYTGCLVRETYRKVGNGCQNRNDLVMDAENDSSYHLVDLFYYKCGLFLSAGTWSQQM